MNPDLNKFLLAKSSRPDPKAIRKEAEQKALALFHQAAEAIPAYKDFLEKNSCKPELVQSIADFKNVPYTSKENYIFAYDLIDRCWNRDITQTDAFACSSGSTGEPVFWPRKIEQEIDGAYVHENLLVNIFQIDKYKTLFINSFGLGNWIAGMYTQMCLNLVKLKGYDLTLASPGYSESETFKVVKAFSQYFDQTIIACHPPVLKMMIENGVDQGIDWQELNIKFWGAGEGFSENWRDYLLSLVGQKDPLNTFINILGSADAGLMGFETPLSIAIHRETCTNHELNQALFDSDRNPYLYQFDPRFKYLESIAGELTITADATMPLIQYNLHDEGDILSFETIAKELKTESLSVLTDLNESWPFPFVYIFGRKQFIVSILAVNIYPEHIKSALEHMSLQPYLTGRYVATKAHDEFQNPYLYLQVELRQTLKSSKELAQKVQKVFVETLKKINSEYNEVEKTRGRVMHPRVELLSYHDPIHFAEGKIKKTG